MGNSVLAPVSFASLGYGEDHPCICGHIGIRHLFSIADAPDSPSMISLDSVCQDCRKAFHKHWDEKKLCLKFKLDNLKYLEKKYEETT